MKHETLTPRIGWNGVTSADTAKDDAVTREEALATYRPIRASVRRILRSAISACNRSDFMRAAKQLGLWADGRIVLPEGDEAAEMLSDIALFEPNQRGRRAFDTVLGGKSLALEAADVELAGRMGDAFFSLFRFSARHEAVGVWLEDLLAGNRKLWLMDESMEASAPTASAFGMRIFDAGEFHIGFGIAVPADDETTEFAVESMKRNGRTPFRYPLAVTLCGDSLRGCGLLARQSEVEFAVLSALIESTAGSRDRTATAATPQRGKARRPKSVAK